MPVGWMSMESIFICTGYYYWMLGICDCTGFFLDSLNWEKDPRTSTFFLFLMPFVGLLPDFNSCIVLPLFSG